MRMMTVSSRRTRNFSKLKHWSSLQRRCPRRARIFRTSRMKSPRRRTFKTLKTQSSRGTRRLKISRRNSAILRRYPTQTRNPSASQSTREVWNNRKPIARTMKSEPSRISLPIETMWFVPSNSLTRTWRRVQRRESQHYGMRSKLKTGNLESLEIDLKRSDWFGGLIHSSSLLQAVVERSRRRSNLGLKQSLWSTRSLYLTCFTADAMVGSWDFVIV
jgi:hypothetical protein